MREPHLWHLVETPIGELDIAATLARAASRRRVALVVVNSPS